ncbi:unnamed protein product [Calypogeia fissa]
MAMEEDKTWAAAASEVLLPQKRKLPRKFRLVEVDEDELKDIFQFLGLGLDDAEEADDEKLEDEDDSEEIQELEEQLRNRFRLTDIEEQQKNLFGRKDPKRRKF